jgi:hypothetical protein
MLLDFAKLSPEGWPRNRPWRRSPMPRPARVGAAVGIGFIAYRPPA